MIKRFRDGKYKGQPLHILKFKTDYIIFMYKEGYIYNNKNEYMKNYIENELKETYKALKYFKKI